jgi:hypothetical protein
MEDQPTLDIPPLPLIELVRFGITAARGIAEAPTERRDVVVGRRTEELRAYATDILSVCLEHKQV